MRKKFTGLLVALLVALCLSSAVAAQAIVRHPTGSGGGGGSAAWGGITGTLSNQTDLQSALDAKQGAFSSQSANRIYAGPVTGSAATPAFRALVVADIPDLSATYSAVGHTHTFASLTSKPTTLSGYGITDAQGLDTTLTALAAFNTNGLLTQTAADTFTARTITGTSNQIDVTNGNGVSGNPTLAISATYLGQTSITTLGTIATGVWNGTAIALNKIATVTASRALVSDGSGNVSAATTTSTEIGYVNGVTSAIQTQLDAKAPINASVNAQTGTTYTLQVSDNGKIVTLSNASAITVTLPSGLGAGFNVLLVQIGAGQVSITTSSTTLNHRQSHTKIAGQYGIASIACYVANTCAFGGDTGS